MRLDEIERGDSLRHRLLIGFISLAMRMRLPDAARVAFYPRSFFGDLGHWTQAAMRGPSAWSVGERELMAALVARWNSNTFCLGAHGAIAGKQLPATQVERALADYRRAGLSPQLVATLTFLEKLTRTPDAVTGADAKAVLAAGVSEAALTDAIAVSAVFNIITRYADALDFAIPSDADYSRAADMLLKRGYA
jgi:uncharacterized peroxidase-related enzyme